MPFHLGTPNKFYHVRISPNQFQAKSDFDNFTAEISESGSGRWDKDKDNKLTTGDYLAFITGPKDAKLVKIFMVRAEMSADTRPEWWVKNSPHTENNGTTPADNRGVVQLTDNHPLPKTIEWTVYREYLGFKRRKDCVPSSDGDVRHKDGHCRCSIPQCTQRVARASSFPNFGKYLDSI